MFWSPLTRRVAFWLTWFTLVVGIAHLFLHVDQKSLEDRFGLHYTRWLDMNAEQSVATWFNVGLLQLAAGLAVLGAIAVATRRERVAWSALAIAIFLLSLDEKISIHEALPTLLGMGQGDLVTHEWLIPGVAIALAALAALVPLLRPMPRPLLLGLLGAMVVYGAGAVGVELLSGIAIRTLEIEHPVRQLMPVWEWIEESLEMLGCILAISALLQHLERIGVVDVARWRRLAQRSTRRRRSARST